MKWTSNSSKYFSPLKETSSLTGTQSAVFFHRLPALLLLGVYMNLLHVTFAQSFTRKLTLHHINLPHKQLKTSTRTAQLTPIIGLNYGMSSKNYHLGNFILPQKQAQLFYVINNHTLQSKQLKSTPWETKTCPKAAITKQAWNKPKSCMPGKVLIHLGAMKLPHSVTMGSHLM